MSKNKIIVLACSLVVPVLLMITGCKNEGVKTVTTNIKNKPPIETPEENPPEERPILQESVDCLSLDVNTCSTKKDKCRYLVYHTPQPAGSVGGLCVSNIAPVKDCHQIDDLKFCELDKYLSTKCQKGSLAGCKPYTEPVKLSVSDLFSQSEDLVNKSGANLDDALNNFDASYRLLDDKDKKELAKMYSFDGVSVFYRLVKLPMRESTLKMIKVLLDEVDATAATALVKAKVNGISPLVTLTDAGRSGDEAAPLKEAIDFIAKKGGDADLKDLPETSVKLFLTAVNAASDESKMKSYLDKLNQARQYTKAWFNYALEAGTEQAKAAVKSTIASSPNITIKGQLLSLLLAAEADSDYNTPPGQPKTKLINMIGNPTSWFDPQDLKSTSLNLTENAAILPSNLPVALARYLRSKTAAPLTPTNIDYLIKVNAALKTKLTDVEYDGLVTSSPSTTAADISSEIAGSADKQKFYADLVLQNVNNAVMPIWNDIKALSLNTDANINTVTTKLQILFDIENEEQRRVAVEKLVGQFPDASSGGLQLIHRIFREPLKDSTKDIFVKIFTLLKPRATAGHSLSKEGFLEMAQGNVASGALSPGRFAIADLFAERPFSTAPIQDAAGTFDEIVNLISSGAPDVDVSAANSVARVMFVAIESKTPTVPPHIRLAAVNEFFELLKRITNIPNSAKALRKKITSQLVTERRTPGGVDNGLIHWLLSAGFTPINDNVYDVFHRMITDLEPAQQTAWVSQSASNFDNKAAISYLLIRDFNPSDTRFDGVKDLIIAANPAQRVEDVNNVWDFLAQKNFNMDNDTNRKSALLLLKKIIGFAGTANGDKLSTYFTLSLMGGTMADPSGGIITFPAKQYPPPGGGIVSPYPQGSYLVQAMMLGPINKDFVDLFEVLLNKQQDASGRTKVLNSVGGVLPNVIKELTDWNRTTAFGAFVEGIRIYNATAGIIAFNASDNEAEWARLVRLFLNNNVDLVSIDGANFNGNRSFGLLGTLLKNRLIMTDLNRDLEFVNFFKNTTGGDSTYADNNSFYLSYYALEDVNRASLIKKIFDSPDITITPARKKELRGTLFLAAIHQDINRIRRGIDPTLPLSNTNPITPMKYNNLASLRELFTHSANWGLPVDFATIGYAINLTVPIGPAAVKDVHQGNLLWLLLAAIRQDRNQRFLALLDNPYNPTPAIDELRLTGLVRTMADLLKPSVPGAVSWGAYCNTASTGGTPPQQSPVGIVDEIAAAAGIMPVVVYVAPAVVPGAPALLYTGTANIWLNIGM